jgi:hypothetical protein
MLENGNLRKPYPPFRAIIRKAFDVYVAVGPNFQPYSRKGDQLKSDCPSMYNVHSLVYFYFILFSRKCLKILSFFCKFVLIIITVAFFSRPNFPHSLAEIFHRRSWKYTPAYSLALPAWCTIHTRQTGRSWAQLSALCCLFPPPSPPLFLP